MQKGTSFMFSNKLMLQYLAQDNRWPEFFEKLEKNIRHCEATWEQEKAQNARQVLADAKLKFEKSDLQGIFDLCSPLIEDIETALKW